MDIAPAPPGPKGTWPLGVMRQLQKDHLAFRLSLLEYGDVVSYPILRQRSYTVHHPDAVEHILQKNHQNYRKRIRSGKHIFARLVGNGLVNNDGAHWLKQRRLIQPTFHQKNLATMVDTMVQVIEAWRDSQHDQAVVHLADEMQAITLSIAGWTLLGIDLTQASALRHALTVAIGRLEVPTGWRGAQFILQQYLPVPEIVADRELETAVATINREIEQIIANRQAAGEAPPDLLSLFMATNDEDGNKMSRTQLRDELMTMLIGGHETTANMLTWCWYLLAKHPHVLQKLSDELQQVLNGKVPTFADLQQLTYTRMVLQETLRLYPPAYMINRIPVQEDVIDGYTIPADANVIISPYAIHRHPAIWKTPDVFTPERFTPENIEKRHRYAFLPFGAGPRKCVGDQFAIMEGILVLAVLAQRWRFHFLEGMRPHPAMTLRVTKSAARLEKM